MAVCEKCGIAFDKAEAGGEFAVACFGLSFENVRPCLCAECAIDDFEKQ